MAVALGAVAAIILASPEQRIATCGWLLVASSAPLVFLNLYLMHTYYLGAIYPAVVAVMAVGLVWVAQRLPRARGQRRATAATVALVALTVVVTGLSTPEARHDINSLFFGPPRPLSGDAIKAMTPKDSRIVMIGCDWDPRYLYYAQREVVMFRDATSGKFWETEPIADYPFLFSCKRDLDPLPWLPPGYTAVAGGAPDLYRVVRKPE